MSMSKNAKVKEGIFIGPQICDLLRGEYFNRVHEAREKAAWQAFRVVVKDLLGNRKYENPSDIVNNLLPKYK